MQTKKTGGILCFKEGRFLSFLNHYINIAKWRNFHLYFSKFDDLKNKLPIKSSLWIFMYQNLIPNLSVCEIAKIGDCTELMRYMKEVQSY